MLWFSKSAFRLIFQWLPPKSTLNFWYKNQLGAENQQNAGFDSFRTLRRRFVRNGAAAGLLTTCIVTVVKFAKYTCHFFWKRLIRKKVRPFWTSASKKCWKISKKSENFENLKFSTNYRKIWFFIWFRRRDKKNNKNIFFKKYWSAKKPYRWT